MIRKGESHQDITEHTIVVIIQPSNHH